MHRTALFALILALFAAVLPAEEGAVTLEFRLDPGTLYRYDIKETKRTLVKDPQTGEAVIFAISSALDNDYVTFSKDGVWLEYVSQRVFRDMSVDEATANGLPLSRQEVNRQKEAELILQRMKTPVFDFGVISENGEPDPGLASNDIKDVIQVSAGNVIFLPPQKREVGDEWARDIQVGRYKVRIVYSFESLERKEGRLLAHIKGALKFKDLPKGDQLSVLKAYEFAFDLDVDRKLFDYSRLDALYSITKDGKVVSRQITLEKRLKGSRALTRAELDEARYEAGLVKTWQTDEQTGRLKEAPEKLEDLVHEGKSLFLGGLKIFLRDHVYPNCEIFGKKIRYFWFTEWLNSKPIEAADCRGKVVLIGFFDPDIASSTRIWRPWEDWGSHWGDKGLVLIAASAAKPEKVKAYVKETGVKWPVALDGDYLMLNRFNVTRIPYFVVLDREGKVCFTLLGKRELYKLHKKLEEFFGPIED